MPLFGRPSAEDDQRAAAWRDWIQQRNPLAIASLVLGIFSFIELGALLIFGVAGIVFGILALRQLRNRPAPIPLAEQSPPRDVGAVSYADSTMPEPIDREQYEREITLAPIYGHRL